MTTSVEDLAINFELYKSAETKSEYIGCSIVSSFKCSPCNCVAAGAFVPWFHLSSSVVLFYLSCGLSTPALMLEMLLQWPFEQFHTPLNSSEAVLYQSNTFDEIYNLRLD